MGVTDSCSTSVQMCDGNKWTAKTSTGCKPHIEVCHPSQNYGAIMSQWFSNAAEMRMLGAWLISNADIQDKLEQEMYRRHNGQG